LRRRPGLNLRTSGRWHLASLQICGLWDATLMPQIKMRPGRNSSVKFFIVALAPLTTDRFMSRRRRGVEILYKCGYIRRLKDPRYLQFDDSSSRLNIRRTESPSRCWRQLHPSSSRTSNLTSPCLTQAGSRPVDSPPAVRVLSVTDPPRAPVARHVAAPCTSGRHHPSLAR